MAPSTQFIEQNLLDIHSRPLVVTSLFETELSEENISSFFTVKTVGDSGDAPVVADPVNIGLAGGYTPSGLLNTLAVSVGSTILLIQFRSKTKATEDAVVAARKLLQDSILCRSHVILHAFNLAPLALSLYCDHGLLLEAGVDVQSGCTCKNPRDPVDATEFATASTQAAKIYRDNIRDVFASDIRDPAKLETSRSLALRAWLAAYIPSLGDMSERLGEVPRINTRSMSADRLRLLGQFTKTGQLLDSKRPTQTAHDVKPISAIDTKVKLTSERFQTRLRATDGRIEIAVEDRHGGQYTVQASTRDVSGRLGVLKAAGAVEGKSIIAVASVDPDAQTLAEQRRDATILSVLQRTSPLFDNPFLRTIWPDSDDVIWPEETFPVSDTPPPLSYQHPLNESQQLAVEAMLSLTNTSRITVIQGPPGSGKTTVIGAFVQSAVDAGWSGIWLLAQSNVAVKNIAEKLGKIGFEDWRLLVSKDFHLGWHEHLYHQISSRTVRSDDIKKASRELKGIKVILSTLSMLSNPRIDMITSKIPVKIMVVDEASQIAVSDYIAPLESSKTLQKICFIGDDRQLPPYGQDEIPDLQSIFEISHLRDKANFLDIQYRMPPHVGDIISAAVYDGQLRSNPEHPTSGPACFFVDVAEGAEKQWKTSWENPLECAAVIKIAAKLQEENDSFRIITPYEAQRSAIENCLKQEGLGWQDKCFNVDSFQGNEDDYIIISVVRSKDLGFLKDLRRTNVMLTRCKRGMFICTSWNFLVDGKGSNSLVGRMAAECGDDAWLSMDDVEAGNF